MDQAGQQIAGRENVKSLAPVRPEPSDGSGQASTGSARTVVLLAERFGVNSDASMKRSPHEETPKQGEGRRGSRISFQTD